MQVVVISDYGKCLKMINDLKLYAGKFKQCVKLNSENENEMGYERIKFYKKKYCKQVNIYDAEEYYKG